MIGSADSSATATAPTFLEPHHLLGRSNLLAVASPAGGPPTGVLAGSGPLSASVYAAL